MTARPVEIRRDGLDHPRVRDLLDEHLRSMASLSPPQSVHALPPDALRAPGVTFWSAWSGDDLLGCGALKELTPRHGEIKSMRTASAHRRAGVARALLDHIVAEARRRGYERLSLETGSMAAFEPARQLYRRAGFVACGPFAGYGADPNSAFLTLELRGAARRPASS